MSMETYESMLETAETDAAILEAETEYAHDERLHDARSAFDSYRFPESIVTIRYSPSRF